MANRNTKQKQREMKAVAQSVGKGKFLVSSNSRRNMAQFVYLNTGADGKKYSITRHEQHDPDKAFYPYKRKKVKHIAGAKVEVGEADNSDKKGGQEDA